MALRVRERYQRLSSSFDDSRRRQALRLCKQNALLLSTVVSVVAAVLVGAIISLCSRPDRVAILCVSLPGEVFLNLLQLLVVPLVVISIVTGIGNMNLTSSGALGWRVLAYYASTTVFASFLGVVLAVTIRPGQSYQGTGREGRCVADDASAAVCTNITAADAVADLIRCVRACVCAYLPTYHICLSDLHVPLLCACRNLFPENLFAATIFQVSCMAWWPPPVGSSSRRTHFAPRTSCVCSSVCLSTAAHHM